eukprot:TRINITY_DN19177_c0_g2_i2.p1 TRINITY_DN19177_c0_g2~~TRINITY_DN19177_c0_g2_i2.p1  ORF type:complete len:371 (-),score=78.67 TRINITY_DN19177_c0_g2_i2:349-1302(-)
MSILQLAGGNALNSSTQPTFSLPLRSQMDESVLSTHRGYSTADFLGPEEVAHTVPGRAKHVKHATEHFRVIFGHPRHRERQQPFWAKVAGILGASVALLGINVLDVVWVLPFLNDKVHGTFNTLFYLLVGQIFVFLSILFVVLRGASGGSAEHEQTVKTLDTMTAVLLVVYAMYCFYEEVLSGQQQSQETKAMADSPSKKLPEDEENEKQDEEEEHSKTSSVRPASVGSSNTSNTKFMVLVVLGSFDQVAVYVPVLTTGILTSLELEIGVLVSSFVAVALCFVIGQSSCMTRILAGIPMWLIVAVLAVLSVVQMVTG